MDELELIRSHRLEETGTGPESRRAARAALEQRMEAARPGPHRGIRRLLPGGAGGASVRPGRRVAVLALGTCAAVAVALVVGLSGGGQVEPAAAAQVLREAARAASEQVPVVPGPHQYLYTRSKGAELLIESRWSVMVPVANEDWISLDGSRKGRIRRSAGDPYFLSPSQRAGWVAAGSPSLPSGGTEESTLSGGNGFVDPADLPGDPAALREGVEDGRLPGPHRPRGEAETFEAIGELLGQASLPSAERAALFEAAAELPRIESLGEVTDPLGRPGVGIAILDAHRATRDELVIDPDTSTLLAERETTTARRYGGFAAPVGADRGGFVAPFGTTIGWKAYLDSRVVDSVGKNATPGAGSFDDSVGCYETASLHGSAAIVHGSDPIATCERLWREGALGTRLLRLEEEGKLGADPDRDKPHLVACTEDGTPAFVFPASGADLCSRLGLAPLDLEAWRSGR